MTIAKLIDKLSEFDPKIPVLFLVSSGPYGFRRTEITNACEISVNKKGSDEDPEIIAVGIGVDLEEEQLDELQNAWY
jgi:hypothetical protein